MSPSPIERTRSGARAALLAAMTTGMLGASQVHRRMLGGEAGEAAFAAWRKAWAGGLLRTFGVDLRVVGQPPPEPQGARLVVANHRSPIDILLALRLVGGTVVSRADLEHWPVLGAAARAADTIFVERGDARSGVSAIREMRRRLQAGKTVILFPEGGTFLGDEVRPFQAGALSAARGIDTEVVALGLAYEPGCEFVGESFSEYTARMAGRPRIPVAVAIGSPQPLTGPRDAAMAKLGREVQTLVTDARCHLDLHTTGGKR